jgi:hypothetical protein
MLAVTLSPARADAQWRYPGYYVPRDLTALRVIVKPNDAKVYVDGYYAGIVDDFDGVFQRLHLPPGQHDIVLYLDGYRTVHQKIYLTPDSTYKLRYTMEKNLAGEASEPPPEPPAGGVETAPGEAHPMPPMPRTPRGGMYPPRQPYPPQQPYPPPQQPYPPQQPTPPEQAPPPPSGRDNGALIVRVQPAAAEVWIDGEQWRGPDGDERLVVQLSEGAHHIEIRKSGYRGYTTDVQVRRGETVPLNVSLSPDRDER